MENIVQKFINFPNPPSATEIEFRVISALIYLGDVKSFVIQQSMLNLNDDCFMNVYHRRFFSLIKHRFEQGLEFSLITILSFLDNDLYNYAQEFIRDEFFTTNYLESDIRQLLELQSQRKQLVVLVNAVNNSLNAKTSNEALSAIADTLQELNHVTNLHKPYRRSVEDILDSFLSKSNDETISVKIDIPDLPLVPNKSLITIAGRSGHGKTFFSLYMLDRLMLAMPDKQHLYFNLEMDDVVLLERLAHLNRIRRDNTKETLKAASSLLMSRDLNIITKDLITIEEIESESRLAALQKPIGVIVVDYLGLVRSKNKAERNDLLQADIAKRLAGLAMSLNCIVIALSQVNRDIKTRPIGDRCPVTTDSSESMGLVHSSSWWLGIDQPQLDSSEPQFQDMFIVKCRKNRGDSGMFELKLKFKWGTFSKWERPFCSSSQKVYNHETPTF